MFNFRSGSFISREDYYKSLCVVREKAAIDTCDGACYFNPSLVVSYIKFGEFVDDLLVLNLYL